MEFNSRVLSFQTYPMTALSQRKKMLQEKGLKVFDFGTGDPIEPTAPFIREAVAKGVPAISQYPTVKGLPEFRAAVRNYMLRRFGVELDAESEILPATGSKESIYSLSFLLIGPGNRKDTIIATQPGYFIPERSAAVSGANFHCVHLNQKNNFLLDLAQIDEAILSRTAICWINYPNNPTGVECDLPYLKRQLEIARKYEILLCSDECYVDIFFGKTAPPSILQLSKEGVLAFHSCSKRSGMTAYRTGFVAGDKSVLKVYAGFRDTLGVATPVYTQQAAIAAWNDDSHVAERLAIFRAKRELISDFLAEQKIEWVKSDSSLYFWIKAPGRIGGAKYSEMLLEKGLIVTPGEWFSKESREYFRVAIVPSLEDCKEALKLWATVKV